jgi:calpain-15
MSKSQRTKSNLSDALLLYTSKQTEPYVSFTYEIECTTFKAVKITLDFEGSENFAVVDQQQSTMKMIATLRPFSRTELGTVRVVSEDRRASLKMGCSWIMSDPSGTEVAEHVRNHQLKMAPLLKEAASLPFPPIVEDPDLKAVEEVCRNYGKNYIDKDFLPTADSLFRPSSSPESRSSAIEWRRAADFMNGPYDVFINAVEPADIRQGALGDCWFLCAAASLAEFPQMILDVVVTPKKHPFGCYCLKFCKNGWWQVVRVDDFFPCYPSGGPIYSKSHGNELWVLLLEKAYSKLHGSYEAIKSGWAYEAMMDMTGAPCITIRFDDSSVKKKIRSGELWRQVLRYDEENFCLSASTPGNPTACCLCGSSSSSTTHSLIVIINNSLAHRHRLQLTHSSSSSTTHSLIVIVYNSLTHRHRLQLTRSSATLQVRMCTPRPGRGPVRTGLDWWRDTPTR